MEGKKNVNIRLWIIAALIGAAVTILSLGSSIHTLKAENRETEEKLQAEIQQGIAKEIFRLHVVANSDTDEDQQLKLKVKTAVVAFLEELLGENPTLEETMEGARANLSQIEKAAQEVIQQEGYTYSVKASVERTYFPDKTYGDCTFPAGEYEALNVRIGEAKGRNWWCVLYPSLCFVDESHGIVSEEKKDLLEEALTEEEFLSILKDPQERRKVQIGFKWF